MIVTSEKRRKKVGTSFPAGAPPLAAVRQVRTMFANKLAKPQLGSWGLLKVSFAADMAPSGRRLATSFASVRLRRRAYRRRRDDGWLLNAALVFAAKQRFIAQRGSWATQSPAMCFRQTVTSSLV